MILLAIYVALSAIPANAATVDNASGSSVSSDVDSSDNTYLQEEFEDATSRDFLDVYIIGVIVGLGCSTALYIIGLGAGFFISILKKYV